MKTLLSRMLSMCLRAGWMVPVLCTLRFLLAKCPKKLTLLLWAALGLRLICPMTVKTGISILPQRLTTAPVPLSGLLGVVWMSGTAAMLLLGSIRLHRLKAKLAEAALCGKNVWLCDYLPVPFVLGVIHPRIFLPSSLRPEEAVLVLAHEQAHVERYDALWKLLAYLLLCVYWFNPLLWLAYWLFCQDVEMACDEKVAAQLTPEARRKYANVMISCASPGAPVPGFGGRGLKARIRAVLGYREPPKWAVPALVLALMVVSVFFLADGGADRSQALHSAADRFFQELYTVASGK